VERVRSAEWFRKVLRYRFLIDVGSGPTQSYTFEREEALRVGEFVKLAEGRVVRIVCIEQPSTGGYEAVAHAIVTTGEIGEGLFGQ
jgi:hypothetical protein